jgi:hypothetical protein
MLENDWVEPGANGRIPEDPDALALRDDSTV